MGAFWLWSLDGLILTLRAHPLQPTTELIETASRSAPDGPALAPVLSMALRDTQRLSTSGSILGLSGRAVSAERVEDRQPSAPGSPTQAGGKTSHGFGDSPNRPTKMPAREGFGPVSPLPRSRADEQNVAREAHQHRLIDRRPAVQAHHVGDALL